MSHELGKVVFVDGSEMFFEYDGTGDYARKRLFDTQSEVEAQWRQPQDSQECLCGGEEPVNVSIDYGGGISFTSTACRKCNVITGPRNRLEAIQTNEDIGW